MEKYMSGLSSNDSGVKKQSEKLYKLLNKYTNFIYILKSK